MLVPPLASFFLFLSTKFSGFDDRKKDPKVCFEKVQRQSIENEVAVEKCRPSDADRRSVIWSVLAGVSSVHTIDSSLAQAIKEAVNDLPDYTCLADLGPIPPNTVRIYACRHGQTENNRLRLAQGSRIDPSLNRNGVAQAERLGKALLQASVQPTKFLHSPLKRVQETAQVAAAKFPTELCSHVLASIAEIDFGAMKEGISAKKAKFLAASTYARWALGDLDFRLTSDGESGRQVLKRIEQALFDLLQEASGSPSRCIAIVSHSSYLPTLLATLKGASLFQVASIKISNASVSVLDIQQGGLSVKVGPQSPLLGGRFSLAPNDFSLDCPQTFILRVNEKRHLGNLVS